MALRLSRPKGTAGSVVARRVGRLAYGLYAPCSAAPEAAAALPWLTYEEAWAHLPQARWIAAARARLGEPAAPLAVNDGDGLLEAVAAGLGKSLLPCAVAGRDPRLRRLEVPARIATAPPVRELWLLVHAELRGLARIAAVAGWLDGVLPRDA